MGKGKPVMPICRTSPSFFSFTSSGMVSSTIYSHVIALTKACLGNAMAQIAACAVLHLPDAGAAIATCAVRYARSSWHANSIIKSVHRQMIGRGSPPADECAPQLSLCSQDALRDCMYTHNSRRTLVKFVELGEIAESASMHLAVTCQQTYWDVEQQLQMQKWMALVMTPCMQYGD